MILVSVTHRSTPLLSARLLWSPSEQGLCTWATLAQQHPDRSCSPHLTVAMMNQSLSSSVMITKQKEESKNAQMFEQGSGVFLKHSFFV